MARIPRLVARRITPSGRVGDVAVPFDIADVGAAVEARGLAALGRGVSRLGRELSEIKIREQRADDLLASDNASVARQSVRNSFNQFRIDNPDPSLWQAKAKQLYDDADKTVGRLEFSSRLNEREKLLHEAEKEHFLAGVRLQTTVQKVDNAITATQDSFVNALESGALDIREKEDSYMEALLNKFSPDVAKVVMKETKQSAMIAKIRNLAAVRPSQISAAISEELKLRGKGRKSSGDLALLSNSDLKSIRDYANSVLTQTKIRIKQQDDEIGEGFLNLLVNKLDPPKPQLTFDMINASGLSFDAKIKWFEKLRTFDNYSEGELKEAFTDKGEVLADIYDKIDNGTLTDELDTMVGRGLSPITAERIKKEIRAPFEKDTEQFLKRIFGWTPELGFGEKKFAAFAYEKVLREWQAEVKKQDATGEKIIEIGRSIARPYLLEHMEKEMPSDIDISRMMELALGKEIKTLEIEPEITEETGEPETYADFRAEVSKLKGEDIERAREYYNIWIGNFKTIPEENRQGGNLRPDGTPKGTGFLGELKLGGKLAGTDAVATEYSVQSNAVKVNGKRIDFPTLVPTLTQEEIDLMINDIIPNRKPIPEPIMQKAIAHAKERLKEGKSVFEESKE